MNVRARGRPGLSLTVSLRRDGQDANTCSASAVAKDRDTVWVATERADIELNPAQSLDLIPQTVVTDKTRVTS